MNAEQARLAVSNNYRGIIDSSLREGEQYANASEFTPQQAREVLSFLHSIGVERAEVPNPLARGMDHYIRELVASPIRPALLTHIRNNQRDLNAALELGLDGVNFLTTVDNDRIDQMGLSLDQYKENLISNVHRAQAEGLETRVSVEHASEADPVEMMAMYQLADDLHVDRVGFADTLGVFDHWEVADRISLLAGKLRHAAIEVHFHNDVMSAVANAIQSVASGAAWVDATLGGYGERTGIVPTSAFILRLQKMVPELVSQRYHPEYLTEAERYMATLNNETLPVNLITSDTAFTHKSGIHVNTVATLGPSKYEPVPPSFIGNERQFVTGTRISGRTTQAQVQEVFNKFGTG